MFCLVNKITTNEVNGIKNDSQVLHFLIGDDLDALVFDLHTLIV